MVSFYFALASASLSLLPLTAAFDAEEACRKVDTICLLTQKYCENYSGLRDCTFPDNAIVFTNGATQRAVFTTDTEYTIKWTNNNAQYPTKISWNLGPGRPISKNVTAGETEYTFKFEDVAALNGSTTDIGYWQALVNGFEYAGNQITIEQPDDPINHDESSGGPFLDLSTQFSLMPIELKHGADDLAPRAVKSEVHKWKLGVGVGVGVGVPVLMLVAFILGWKMPKKGKPAKTVAE